MEPPLNEQRQSPELTHVSPAAEECKAENNNSHNKVSASRGSRG